MVGRAAVEQLTNEQLATEQVVGLAHQDLDIANRDAVFEIVKRERPGAIINCAAWTDVDGCESDKDKAFAVNSFGVENLALAAREVDAAFVTVSTDYVFDGAKQGFYTQRDTPNPTSVYGASKLDGERRANLAYARTIIARTAWVYGDGGTNFLSRIYSDAENFLNEMRARNLKIKAINDAYGTPTHAADLAARLIELAQIDLPGIYHVTGAGEGTTYSDFTVRTLEHFGLAEAAREIETVSHATLNRPAPRPQNSRLRCLLSERIGLKALPGWEEKVLANVKQVTAGNAGESIRT